MRRVRHQPNIVGQVIRRSEGAGDSSTECGPEAGILASTALRRLRPRWGAEP